MKHTRKIVASLILAIMLLSSVLSVGVSAADDGTTIYFAPDSNWSSDNARFAVYAWNSNNDYVWVDLTDDDSDGIFEATIPSGYVDLIFARLNPNDDHNGWSTTWNQTVDCTIPNNGDNLFTITNPWGSESNNNKGEGSWSKYDAGACVHDCGADCICKKCGKEVFYIIAGNVMKKDGEYMKGDNSTLFVSKWDVADENNRMFYDENLECFVKVYEGVAAGEYEFKIAVDKSWDNKSYGDNDKNVYLLVEEDGSTVVITFKNGTIKCASAVVADSDNVETPDNSDSSDNIDNSDTTNDSNNSDKDNSDKNEEPVKLNFFQKIWLAIKNFFANLFGGKK